MTGRDALTTEADRLARADLLGSAHVEPLERCRAAIEARFGPTPHVDPWDGGIAARLLILLETPGPRMGRPRFVSRDNPTGTARNLRRFLADAGIPRDASVLWNVVPWVIHREGARNRPPTRPELRDGQSLLPGFLALLPRLRVVVAAGRLAAEAHPRLLNDRPDLTLLAMPHPSPTYVCTSPDVPRRIGAVLAEAARQVAA